MVERALIVPPASRIGPLDDSERRQIITSSVIYGRYEKAVDRESAYEKLKARTEQKQAAAAPAPVAAGSGTEQVLSDLLFGKTGPRGGKQSRGIIEAMATSAARSIGSGVGREILRGVLGSILGKKR